MSASGFVMLTTDELGRATGLSAMADGEFITSAIIPSAITPFVINQANGQVEFEGALPADTTVSFGDGDFVQTNGKVISRFIHAANELSAAPTCLTRLEGTVSALSGISVSGTLSSTVVSSTTVDSVEASSTDFFTPDGGAFNCMGADGQKFSMKRENGATYENLIKSDEGTITIQSEDDIHFLSNTGEKFMRLNESGGDGEVELYYNNSLKLETIDTGVRIDGSVSATAVSGLTVNGMPYPAPFGYMQLDSDDTASVDEKKLGYSNTPTTIVTDGITWDDTNKYFVAANAGTYEVMGVVILEGGSTLVDLTIQKNGADVLAGQPRVHSTVDPLEHTIRAVFTMTDGQNANITYDATSSNSVKAITGSTMTIKRLA